MRELCAIFVDAGTTNTRIWLVSGREVIARSSEMVGVRDTARDGSSERLRKTLRNLITEVSSHPGARECNPSFVAAAGMITSSLGLTEVPHIVAPAGIDELASNIRRYEFPDVTTLPVLLVPGVRTGPQHVDLGTLETADLMRGEETMCVGLLEMDVAPQPCTVINLGSHWKVIRIDPAGRIAGSITTLAGEMIHTTQTQTILASAVPHTRPDHLDPGWIEAGISEQRRSGLARALFCVRLLEQGRPSSPEERLAFLIGAFIASDLDALIQRRLIASPVIITGVEAIASAWRRALEQVAINARVISGEELERASLAGLRAITGSAFT
jgi:2-dehydro-3-deoxygalactonokinase